MMLHYSEKKRSGFELSVDGVQENSKIYIKEENIMAIRNIRN